MKKNFLTMKNLLFTIGTAIIALAVASCGPGEAKLNSMPSGANIEKAYKEVIKSASLSKNELSELAVTFKKSRYEGASSSATITVTLNDPANEGSFLVYLYDFEAQRILSINRGTLSFMNERGGLDKATAYDEYQYLLFTTNDFPSFSKFDSMYKAAVDKSGFDSSTAYAAEIHAEFDDKTEALEFRIRVQRSPDKNNDEDLCDVYFDKGGNITRSVLVSEIYN